MLSVRLRIDLIPVSLSTRNLGNPLGLRHASLRRRDSQPLRATNSTLQIPPAPPAFSRHPAASLTRRPGPLLPPPGQLPDVPPYHGHIPTLADSPRPPWPRHLCHPSPSSPLLDRDRSRSQPASAEELRIAA
ncbi:hypothetical protein PVAP13_2NG617300 [Panicum virgatum]|uniref:Uncharacterized protein n=1 Tax=Panicum virgatum TaxID=38727 RepID=A0A8T0VXM0_PANVG|nr:hypothetical protein PVAP13_2NG617300 [Panicum virgatum]